MSTDIPVGQPALKKAKLDHTLSPIRDNPLVTVIVPSFNQGAYIENTIESVLNQDYEPIELIIVDGGSSDNTLEVLRKYDEDPRVCWVSEPDDGPWPACNKGLRMATGDLLGTIFSSDIYQPGAVREAVQEFALDPVLALVAGSTGEIDEHGNPLLDPTLSDHGRRRYYSAVDIISRKEPPVIATFIRRDLVLAIRGWDEDLTSNTTLAFLPYMLEVARLNGHSLQVDRHWANLRRHPNARHDLHLTVAWGLRRSVQVNISCQRYAEEYKDYLTVQQVKALRRTGYFSELSYRVAVLRQFGPALPALWGYLRYGGLSQTPKRKILRHLFSFMLARIPGRARPS